MGVRAVAAALLWAVPALAADPLALKNERCARRLSTVLVAGPRVFTIPQSAAADPQSMVDSLLASAGFANRFAGWVDSKFNRTPSVNSPQNAAFHLARFVIANGLQWKELFVGHWTITNPNAIPTVAADPNGLGYFRSPPWMQRYAGNEPAGYRLTAAYRILQNVVGLQLLAAANNSVGDNSANGRQRPECRGCHFDSPYALDKVARVLSRRVGTGNDVTFTPPTDGPQVLFNGVTIHDDAELLQTLVSSDQFVFNTCRLAFEYLYGRPENACEALVFDRCAAAFRAEGTIQAAVGAIAKDPSFCD